MMDKGFEGIQKDFPPKPLYLPFKARRGHPLSEAQKEYNRPLSSYRIVVEHTNARLNQFGALSGRCGVAGALVSTRAGGAGGGARSIW